MARTGNASDERFWRIEYSKVQYACVNAPGFTKNNTDGHTVGTYSYGNGAGARWGYAMRPKTCDKCGGIIVTGSSWDIVKMYQDMEKRAEAERTQTQEA